ncbi:hypothetical protein D3C85_1117450 [compost metagenome]
MGSDNDIDQLVLFHRKHCLRVDLPGENAKFESAGHRIGIDLDLAIRGGSHARNDIVQSLPS